MKISIYDARNNFSALVKRAEEGDVIELTRYDKPVAVIISYEIYKKNSQNEENWLLKWRSEHHDELVSVGDAK